MKQLLVLSFTVLLFTACSTQASDQAIQTAIAETFSSRPTETINPKKEKPTESATPVTVSPSPSPTYTSPTPTLDNRVIVDNLSEEIVCQNEDLPEVGDYFSTHDARLSNKKILSSWGVAQGQKYINDTGRINGWEIKYERGNKYLSVPAAITCEVSQYATVDGARLAVANFGLTRRDPPVYWRIINEPLNLGSLSMAGKQTRIMWSGDVGFQYQVEFAYQNYRVSVWVYGLEREKTAYIEAAKDVAQRILNKLKPISPANSQIISDLTPTITPHK